MEGELKDEARFRKEQATLLEIGDLRKLDVQLMLYNHRVVLGLLLAFSMEFW